jgi:uncharacterized protein (TIGR03066 family)
MRLLTAAVAVLLALAFAAGADDKKDKKDDKKEVKKDDKKDKAKATKIEKDKLIGVWTYVKTDAKDAPPEGSVKVEFTKDGKLTVTSTVKDKDVKLSGAYKLDGDKLTITLKGPKDKEKTETSTITELTDKKLVIADKKGDKTETTELKK